MSRRTVKPSITKQFKNDLRAARKIWMPWRVLLPYGLFCLAVIIVCDRFGRLNMSLPLLNSIGVFGLLIYLKWNLRRQLLFWAALAAFAVLHALFIWYVPWTEKWVPAVAIAGISSIDFCLMLWILIAVEMSFQPKAAITD